MKRNFSLIAVLLLALLLVSCAEPVEVTMSPDFATAVPTAGQAEEIAPSGEGTLRIGLVIPGLQNEAMLGLKNGVEQRAAELGNIELLTTADQDAVNQVSAFDNYLAAGVDAIIFDSMDTNAIVPSVLNANAQNIPLVAMYAGAAKGDQVIVSSDPRQYGIWIGEWMCENVSEGGEVSIVEGDPGDEWISKARDGVVDTVKACGLDLVAMAPTMFDRQRALDVATDQLTAHPDIEAMYCAIDDLAIACYQAALAAGRGKDSDNRLLIAGVNLTCEAAQSLLKGEMEFTMAQLPVQIGRTALDTIVKMVNGEEVPPEIISNGIPVTSQMARDILAGNVPNPEGTDILERLQRADAGCK